MKSSTNCFFWPLQFGVLIGLILQTGCFDTTTATDASIKIGDTQSSVAELANRLNAKEVSSEMAMTDSDASDIWEFADREIVLAIDFDPNDRVSAIRYWTMSDFENPKTVRDSLSKDIVSISLGREPTILVEKKQTQ